MGAPQRRFRAPGRVNLIGDHTDHQRGDVLPMAIDRECFVTRREGASRTRAVSLDGHRSDLESFVAASLATLARQGITPPSVTLEVRSEVPIGVGLSSSAALGVAVMRALTADIGVSPTTLARWARDAEERATGVPSGLMDQLTSACGVAGHALLIDCEDEHVEPIALPDELGVAVVGSGITRALADGAYAERRRACDEIAARLGVDTLRHATLDQVAGEPRARHVVTEHARVLEAADALRARDVERLGRLVLESHASLRDDFAVSTPELDRLVELLVDAGAAGARVCGAGFGGCVVAVGRAHDIDDIATEAANGYAHETGITPLVLVPRAVAGASELDGDTDPDTE